MADQVLRQELLVADGDPDRFRTVLEEALAQDGSRFQLDVSGDDFEIVVTRESELETARRIRAVIDWAEARSGARVRVADARWDMADA